jgi:cyclin-dependent kinase regulatory subunit CKS1
MQQYTQQNSQHLPMNSKEDQQRPKVHSHSSQISQAQPQPQPHSHAHSQSQRSHHTSNYHSQTQRPKPLTPQERDRIFAYREKYYYSPRYSDDEYEYRHVALPRDLLKIIPSDFFSENGTFKILLEDEWRGQLGITQSLGWVHYGCHAPEPHILLFRKPKN